MQTIQKCLDARRPKFRGVRRTNEYAATMRDEGNAADRYFSIVRLVINSGLRLDSVSVSVFYFHHLAHRISQLDDLGVGVASCEDEVHQGGLPPDEVEYLLQVDEAQVQGVVDLVEDEDVIEA